MRNQDREFSPPGPFEERMRARLGEEYVEFARAMSEPPPISILLNRAKLAAPPFSGSESVPWHPDGYYLPARPSFTLDPLFHAGAYYVMEPSSMLVYSALSQLIEPGSGMAGLDLCASPGGKTLAISPLLGNGCLLVSNEVNVKRHAILKENIAKWGNINIHSSRADPSKIQLHQFFDYVIVDAPCSGEGLFRKDPKSIEHWSEANVKHCSLRQKRILTEALRMVKPGGFILYSTCTFSEEENIEQVLRLMHEHQLDPVKLNFTIGWGVTEIEKGGAFGYQCFPHKVKGEGFFLSVMRKGHPDHGGGKMDHRSVARQADQKQTRVPDSVLSFISDSANIDLEKGRNDVVHVRMREMPFDLKALGKGIPLFEQGFIAGQIKGELFIPSHELALSGLVSKSIPTVDLDLESALKYLRKDRLEVTPPGMGWLLARYQGIPIGWLKGTGRELKNYYPMHLRIRMS